MDCTIKNTAGETVLHYVAEHGTVEAMEIIRDARLSGVDMDAKSVKGTASELFRQRYTWTPELNDAFEAVLLNMREAEEEKDEEERDEEKKEDGGVAWSSDDEEEGEEDEIFSCRHSRFRPSNRLRNILDFQRTSSYTPSASSQPNLKSNPHGPTSEIA